MARYPPLLFLVLFVIAVLSLNIMFSFVLTILIMNEKYCLTIYISIILNVSLKNFIFDDCNLDTTSTSEV